MSEIASAYVSLIPSFRGGAARIRDELGPDVDRAGEGSGRSFGSKMLSGLTKVGIGGAVAAIFAGAVSSAANQADLVNKLGLNPGEAKTAAKVAGKLYAGSFADSMDEVNDAIKVVAQNLGGVGDGKKLQGLTQRALALNKTFGIDVAGSVNAVSQMLRTGMAKNAEQAFDIIAKGSQIGADKAGDLLDTFNEYGTQFRKLGIDGPHALGLIQQGLQGGARDSDLVADALKEFSIRAVDGSKLSISGFKALGLSASVMMDQIGRGGKGASAGLQTVLERLRNVKSPADRAQIATSLFGTQAEDLGSALYDLNPATALAAKGMNNIDGTSKRVAGNLKNTVPPFELLKAQIMGTFTALGAHLVPVLLPFVALVKRAGAPLTYFALGLAGLLVAIRVGMGIKAAAIAIKGAYIATRTAAAATYAFTVATSASAAATIRQTTATVASKVVQLAVAAATRSWAAATWLLNAAMSANPLALVAIAIVALGVGLVIAYKKSQAFRAIVSAAFGAVKTVVVGVARFFTDTLPAAFTKLVGALRSTFNTVVAFLRTWGPRALIVVAPFIGIPLLIYRNFAKIKGWLSGVWNSVVSTARERIGALVTAVTGLPGRIAGLAGRMLSAGRNLMTSLFDGIKGALSATGSFVSGLGKSIVNSIVRAINTALSLPIKLPRINTHIPGVGTIGGQTVLPAIPQLAKGGIIPATPGGRLVNVAEAGQAEAVIPLDRLGEFSGPSRSGPVVAGDLVIQQVDDTVGTARAVTRRLSYLGAV